GNGGGEKGGANRGFRLGGGGGGSAAARGGHGTAAACPRIPARTDRNSSPASWRRPPGPPTARRARRQTRKQAMARGRTWISSPQRWLAPTVTAEPRRNQGGGAFGEKKAATVALRPRFQVSCRGGFAAPHAPSKLRRGNGEARMMRAALLSVIGVLLLGTPANAQAYIYHGNDTGGIIPW